MKLTFVLAIAVLTTSAYAADAPKQATITQADIQEWVRERDDARAAADYWRNMAISFQAQLSQALAAKGTEKK